MKTNMQVIHVTPYGLTKLQLRALLTTALLCTAVFAVALAFAIPSFGEPVSVPAGIALVALLGGVGLWTCFWYYGIHLPKFSIAMNITEKEITLVTPKQRVTAPFCEVSYTVTSTLQARSQTYYLHLFHKGNKLIRINTGDWKNIRFLLDLPHKPDPKINKLRELRKYS